MDEIYQLYKKNNIAHEYKWVKEYLLNSRSQNLDVDLKKILQRRIANEPLAYIIGSHPFCGLDILVGPGVLIPRPETEELVGLVVEENKFLNKKEIKIVDFGSGSGCLGLAVAKEYIAIGKKVKLFLVENSKSALKYLNENVQNFLNDSNDKIEIEVVDNSWKTFSVTEINLILSNPPYLTEEEYQDIGSSVRDYEPKEALVPKDAGSYTKDGLDCYRQISKISQSLLENSGILALEIGLNSSSITNILKQDGFKKIKLVKDFCQKNRFIFCSK